MQTCTFLCSAAVWSAVLIGSSGNEIISNAIANDSKARITNPRQRGENTNAQTRYADIPNNIVLKEEAITDWEQYGIWLNLRASVNQEGRNWDSLSVAQFEALDGLVDYWDTQAGLNAMEVLNFHYGDSLFIPPAFNENWTPRTMSLNPMADNDSWIKVYPNPAGVYANFELVADLKVSNEQWRISLTDMTGRQIIWQTVPAWSRFATIDLRNLPPGMYLYEVEAPGLGTEKGKLNVVK